MGRARSYFTMALLFGAVAVGVSSVGYGQEGVVIILEGRIVDSDTGKPVRDATISTNLDVSPIQSDVEGRFKTVLMSSQPVEVRVRREGYREHEEVIAQEPRVQLTVKLEPQEAPVGVSLSSFTRGQEMRGTVENLPQVDLADLKVVAYVLTDKWYIHPFANNTEGEGFSTIDEHGRWRLKTVWRGHQAYRLAVLVVRRNEYVPPQVDVESANPDQELLASVKAVASHIQDAPEGI